MPEKRLTKIQKSALHRSHENKNDRINFGVLLFGSCGVLAADPQVGTWRLNQAKSKITAGTGRNTKVVYSGMFGNMKVTTDGIDAKGKPTYSEWSGKFDGKYYAVTGDPNQDTRSYTKVDDRTMKFAVTKGGKITVTGRIVVSADGKSRTANVSGTTPKGKKFKNVVVYDKQ